MWGRFVACLLTVGCGAHHEQPPRAAVSSKDWRCTLRISPHGIFVDGEPVSRADAVAHCKRAAGGAVVIIEDEPRSVWNETAGALVVVEDKGTRTSWDETRSALEREGVKIYVRGSLCYDPRPLGCRPRAKPETLPPPEVTVIKARANGE